VNTDLHPERKILNRKESNLDSSTNSNSQIAKEPTTGKKDTGKLVVPEKSDKQDKKGKLLPVDGN
jgi:hypothetical protein